MSNARCEGPVLDELRKRPTFTLDRFNEAASRCGLDQPFQRQDLLEYFQARGLVETLPAVPRGRTRRVEYRAIRRKGLV